MLHNSCHDREDSHCDTTYGAIITCRIHSFRPQAAYVLGNQRFSEQSAGSCDITPVETTTYRSVATGKRPLPQNHVPRTAPRQASRRTEPPHQALFVADYGTRGYGVVDCAQYIPRCPGVNSQDRSWVRRSAFPLREHRQEARRRSLDSIQRADPEAPVLDSDGALLYRARR